MYLPRHCKKCRNPVESDRPKQSQYCKGCAATRSRDWKQEHPEKAKLYDSVVPVRDWQEKQEWNRYIQNWRLEHHEAYRKQNRLHLQTHRSFRRRKQLPRVLPLLLLVILGLAAASPHALAVSWEPEKLKAVFEFYDQILFKAMAAVGLTFTCIRIILIELREVRKYLRMKSDSAKREKSARRRRSGKY